jgi:hypothetical protein
MTIEEMHSYDTAEALRKAKKWSKKSRHSDPTYPMNATAKVYNFPEGPEAKAAAKAANTTSEVASDNAATSDAGASTASDGADKFIAVINNQGKLEQMMRADQFLARKLPGSEATYVEPDSFSWIEPYYPRDHAYTWP